jgi:hypothetical protein
MKNKQILFIIPFISIVFIVLLFFTKRDFNRAGVSSIKKTIRSELAGIISNTPNLSIYQIGNQDRFKLIGDNPPYKGKIWYGTTLNGETADLVVYWEGSSNTCQIDKIAVESTVQSEQVIWLQNRKIDKLLPERK